MVTADELSARLGVARRQISTWLRGGLPSQGKGAARRFDPAAVAAWLVEQGHAQAAPPPPAPQVILRTVAEVATALGVRERTVHTWIREGMPGRPGLPGRREGHFPLDEIEAWAATRRSPGEDDPDTSKAQAQSRRLLAQAKLAELEYDRRRGQLVDADEMSRRWLRHIFEVKAQSKQLTTRVMQRLPPAIDTPTRTRIRQEIDRSLAQMFLAMQSFLLSEADDAEQPTEQSTEQPTDQTPAATPPTTKTGPSHAKPHRKKKRSTLAKKTS